MTALPIPPERFRPNPQLKLREQLGEVMRCKSLETTMPYLHAEALGVAARERAVTSQFLLASRSALRLSLC